MTKFKNALKTVTWEQVFYVVGMILVIGSAFASDGHGMLTGGAILLAVSVVERTSARIDRLSDYLKDKEEA